MPVPSVSSTRAGHTLTTRIEAASRCMWESKGLKELWHWDVIA